MKPFVVVETNFANQIVLERDGGDVATAASEIHRYAAEGSIRLCVPAFSLLEAESTFRSAARRRNRIASDLKAEEVQLDRSPISRSVAEDLRAFRKSFVEIAREENNRYFTFLQETLGHAGTIPLDAEVLREALGMAGRLELSLPDAVVFASCIRCFREEPDQHGGQTRIFLSQNRRDFDTQDVRRELQEVDAELSTDYRACLALIRSAL